MVEEGFITHEGGRWHRAGTDAPELHIPEGLRDVIGKRLSRLSPECNRLLAVASVIGRDFSLEILGNVVQAFAQPGAAGPQETGPHGAEEDRLIAALEEAVRVGVLEERARVGGAEYRFSHAFFRQTLYEEMSVPRRLRQHQQVARVLEAQYATRLGDHAAELADHFAHSSDKTDLAKAVQYGEMAAGRAMAVYAYGEAVRLLEQALEVQEVVDPGDARKRCDLLLALGEALMPAGEPLRVAENVAKEALVLAEAIDDTSRASRACREATWALWRYGFFATANTPAFREWAEKADRYAQPGTADRVHADRALARAARAQGLRPKAREFSARALALARQLNDPEALYTAVGDWVVQQAGIEHEEEQFRVVQEFLEHPHQGVSTVVWSQFLARAGQYYFERGMRDRAEAVWEEHDALASRTSDPSSVLMSLDRAPIRATLDGKLEEAAGYVDVLLDRARELGVEGRGRALQACGRALVYLGRAEEALSLHSFEGAPSVHQRTYESYALCLAHLGRWEEVQAYLEDPLAPFGGEAPVFYVAMLFEAAVIAGHRQAVEIMAPRLESRVQITMGSNGLMLCSLGRLRGAGALLLGHPAEARTLYQRALDDCRRIRSRPEVALTRLELAELLLQEAVRHQQSAVSAAPSLGKERGLTADRLKADALAHLDFAIAEFRAMKMQPALERALRHKGLLGA